MVKHHLPRDLTKLKISTENTLGYKAETFQQIATVNAQCLASKRYGSLYTPVYLYKSARHISYVSMASKLNRSTVPAVFNQTIFQEIKLPMSEHHVTLEIAIFYRLPFFSSGYRLFQYEFIH